jgi:hypothetical protein
MRRSMKVKARNSSVTPRGAVLSAGPAGRRLMRVRGVSGEEWGSAQVRGTVSTRLRAGLVLRRVVRSAGKAAANSTHGARNR